MADTGINILSKEGTNIAYFAPNKTPILTKSSLKLTLSDDTRYNIICDKVCRWLATGLWLSPVYSTNKIDRPDITEILLKVALKIPPSNDMLELLIENIFGCVLQTVCIHIGTTDFFSSTYSFMKLTTCRTSEKEHKEASLVL